MANKHNPNPDPDHPLVYQIRLQVYPGAQWTEWLGGLTITLQENGDTLLTGTVVDQATLNGLLRKVRDLGLPLLEVKRMKPSQADAPTVKE